jgi:hypothetical protein
VILVLYIISTTTEMPNSVNVIDPMIERLSESSKIPLPRWLSRFRGAFGYWDDAFY